MKVVFLLLVVATIGAYAGMVPGIPDVADNVGEIVNGVFDHHHGHHHHGHHHHGHHHHGHHHHSGGGNKRRCKPFFCEKGSEGKLCDVNPNDIKTMKGNMQELMTIVGQKVGPKAAKIVVKLLTPLMKMKLLGKLVEIVAKFSNKLIRSCGLVEKLLGGGAKYENGKNFSLKQQQMVYGILSKGITNNCVACYTVKLITLLLNGALLGKLKALSKILAPVFKLLPKLMKMLKIAKKVTDLLRKLQIKLLGGGLLPKGKGGKLLGIL